MVGLHHAGLLGCTHPNHDTHGHTGLDGLHHRYPGYNTGGCYEFSTDAARVIRNFAFGYHVLVL